MEYVYGWLVKLQSTKPLTYWSSSLCPPNVHTTIKNIIGIGIVVGVVLGGIGLYKNSQGNSGEVVKIGVALPLTGENSIYGESGKRGAELAAEKANKENSTKIELVFEDDQMDPKRTVSVVQKMLTVDKVSGLVSMSSGQALAACPLAEQAKVIAVTTGSAPSISNCGEYTFRMFPSDINQAKEMAKLLTGKGFKRVAVIYINNDYGKGLVEEFKKEFQGDIVAIESHGAKESNFRSQLAKIKGANPDVIVAFSYIPEGYSLLKQKIEMRMAQPIFTSEGFKDESLFANVATKALESLRIIFVAQFSGKETQTYKARHVEKYGQDPGIYSDFIYDGVLAIAAAMQECASDDRGCIKDAMYRTNFEGATGIISFDANGDIKDKPYQLYKVENGKFVEAQ
ncbi:MAG: LivK2 [Candidatus Wolfebacteria bacterium GW2011_GWE2_44_13]|uniref:LivK2 n=1 Tax=Candidatus Wolfebacteria bacterium GW2011_GWE2_44_13 TaxID=1619017 RepID=A0A0G1H9I5_9BACT|nr:MAG: LivK2 [Candidatus Wolfebacteria bacterium GW2011_GWE2_44_13]